MLTQNEIKETLEKFLVFKEKKLIDSYKSYVSLYRSSHSYSAVFNQIKSTNSIIDYSILNEKTIHYLKKIDIYTYFGQPGLVTLET